MAFEILKYEAGRASGSEDPRDRAAAKAKVLSNLIDSATALKHRGDRTQILESKKAARADIIQETIDPNRLETDAAYAATVLRNSLHGVTQDMHAQLDDPLSEFSNMEPDKFKKYLQEQTTAFYKQNADHPHSKVLADVFSTYTFRNQDGIVAKQAKQYKDIMRQRQFNASIVALSDLPPGAGDAFNLNTTYLINEMLPNDRYTTAERREAVLQAARAAATNNDGRLLEYAKEFYDVEALNPIKTQQVNTALKDARRNAEDVAWIEAEAEKAGQALDGIYTREQWESDRRDPDMIERFGRSQIDSWYRQSREQHKEQLNYSDAYSRFVAGVPMTNTPAKVQQQVMMDHKRALIEQYGDTAKAMPIYAGLLAKSGLVDKELQMDLAARLESPVYTIEQVASPDFQEALTMAGWLSQSLSPRQMKEQMGETAYEVYALWDQHMTANGYDPKLAAESWIQTKNLMDEQAKVQAAGGAVDFGGVRGTGVSDLQMQEAVRDIAEGRLDTSDPHGRKWLGMASRSSDAILTQTIENMIVTETKIQRTKGFDASTALELSKNKVAGMFRYVGGEQIFTGGATLNSLFAMPDGVPEKEAYRAYDEFLESFGLDADKIRFQKSGMLGTFVNVDGSPIEIDGEKMPPFPLYTIGQAYALRREEEAAERSAKEAQEKIDDIASANRRFENVARAKSQGNLAMPLTKDGVTLGEYMDMDEEQRTLIRRTSQSEQWRWLREGTKKFRKFVHDAQVSNPKKMNTYRSRDYLNYQMVDKYLQGGVALDELSQEQQRQAAEEMEAEDIQP